MKTRILLLLISFPASLIAQPSYLPIIDSSVACNPSKGYFFVVEQMPSPVQPMDEIANLLKHNVQYTQEELNANNQIFVQFMVNCEGDPGDYQLTQCPDTLINVGKQIVEVFRNESIKWDPGKQKGVKVDVFIIFEIKIAKGEFAIIGPLI